MAMHFAGSPISFMANVHCAAATENFIALEHHSVDVSWWEDLVTGIDKPFNRGFARVPEGPGLGIELNLDVVKEHLERGQELFGARPTNGIGNVRTTDCGAEGTRARWQPPAELGVGLLLETFPKASGLEAATQEIGNQRRTMAMGR